MISVEASSFCHVHLYMEKTTLCDCIEPLPSDNVWYLAQQQNSAVLRGSKLESVAAEW